MRYSEVCVLLLRVAAISVVANITPTSSEGEAAKDLTSNKILYCQEEESNTVDSNGLYTSVRWPDTRAVSSDSLSAADLMTKGILSEPLCLSETKEPIVRWCLQQGSSGIWFPRDPPQCEGGVQKHYEVSNCLPPFKELETNSSICIYVSEPDSWSPSCLQNGSDLSILDLEELDFQFIINELKNSKIESVWLPARREAPFQPVLHKLPGTRWNRRPRNITTHKIVKVSRCWSLREECIALNVNTLEVETKNCSKRIRSVCVTVSEAEKYLLRSSCPEGYVSPKSYIGKNNRCFKIYNDVHPTTWHEANNVCRSKSNGHLIKISSIHDNFVFQELAKSSSLKEYSKCWIGLRRRNGKMNGFVWDLGESKSEEITFVNWNDDFSQNQIFVKTGSGGVIDTNGTWSLLPVYSTLKCFACECSAESFDTDIFVKYSPASKKLKVTVYWPRGLFKEFEDDKGFQCFTDSAGDFVTKLEMTEVSDKKWNTEDFQIFNRIQKGAQGSNINFHVHKKIYYSLHDAKYSGHYWCEGHKLPNYELKKSNTVLVLRKEDGHIYSLVMDIHGKCEEDNYSKTCDPTFSDILKTSSTGLAQLLSRCSRVSVRGIKIANVFDNGTLRVLFHLETFQGNTATKLEDYKQTLENVKRTVEKNDKVYTLLSFLSTGGCPADVTNEGHEDTLLHWTSTQLGSSSVSSELCLDQEGIPVRRKCLGDFTNGAYWDNSSGKCVNKNISYITNFLHNLLIKSSDYKNCELAELTEKTLSLVKSPDKLGVADVYFVAKILNNIAEDNWKDGDVPELKIITQILNYVQEARSECIKVSQAYLNSTNILLDSFQGLMEKITKNFDSDVILSVTSQIIVQISDPVMSNVTGLAFLRNQNSLRKSLKEQRSFTDLTIKPLKPNTHTPEFLLNLEEVEVAVWVPEDVITEFIKNNSTGSWNKDTPSLLDPANRPKIVIIIFSDDTIFHNISDSNGLQCSESINDRSFINVNPFEEPIVVSHVVSVSIPGYDSDLPVPIPIIFKPLVNVSSSDTMKHRQCTFWDFTYNSFSSSSSFGGWSPEGCVYAGNSTINDNELGNNFSTGQVLDFCVCTHLTHFSVLVYNTDSRSTASFGFVEKETVHKKALDLITIAGCLLSLVGVLGIILTAIFFKNWRQKPGSKILLQLSLALGIQMTIFILSSADIVKSGYERSPDNCTPDITLDMDYDDNTAMHGKPGCPSFSQTISCTITGALLHYSIMSAFAWMLITALLQFFRYVKVLGATRPPRFFIKSMLFGWGVPTIPVILVLLIDHSCYKPPSDESTLLCYPSGLSLVLAVLVPVGLTVLTNFIVYVMIIYNIMQVSDRKDRRRDSCPLILQQLRLGVLLFFLLGLSWFFGLMAAVGAGVVFSYLFCCTATIQGFALFLFFVVFDPPTRDLWCTAFVTWKRIALRASGSAQDLLSTAVASSMTTPHKAIR